MWIFIYFFVGRCTHIEIWNRSVHAPHTPKCSDWQYERYFLHWWAGNWLLTSQFYDFIFLNQIPYIDRHNNINCELRIRRETTNWSTCHWNKNLHTVQIMWKTMCTHTHAHIIRVLSFRTYFSCYGWWCVCCCYWCCWWCWWWYSWFTVMQYFSNHWNTIGYSNLAKKMFVSFAPTRAGRIYHSNTHRIDVVVDNDKEGYIVATAAGDGVMRMHCINGNGEKGRIAKSY